MLLATLREADESAGRTRPTRADARSLRVHGTAARLTPAAGWVLATGGAAASLVALVILLTSLGRGADPATTGADLLSTPASLVQLLATAAAPALVSLGIVALLRTTRALSDPAAVLAGALATMAWSLAALTSASWGVGFERGDAGLAPTPFSAATWPMFLAAAGLGTLAAAPVWDGVLSGVPALGDDPRRARGRSSPRVLVRRGLALLLGAPTAVLLGLGALAPASGFVAGAGVAVVCLLLARSSPATQQARGTGQWGSAGSAEEITEATAGGTTPAITGASSAPQAVPAPTPCAQLAPGLPRPGRSLVADGRRAALAAQLAVAALVVGSMATAYGVWGSSWQTVLFDASAPVAGLPPMNLALVVGTGAAMAVVAAVALLARAALMKRWGWCGWLVVGAVMVALVLRAVTAAMGPEGEAGTYVLFGGALIVGLAVAAPLTRVLPGRGLLRWSTAVVCGVAVGFSAGFQMLAVAPLLSPLAAGVVLVALVVSVRRARGRGQGDQSRRRGITT